MGTAAAQWREPIPPHRPRILRSGSDRSVPTVRPGLGGGSPPPGPAPATEVPASELGGGAEAPADADRKVSARCSF